MLFNSYVFIFVFLPTVLAGYWLVRKYYEKSWAIVFLVVASFIYYAWWKPQYIILLIVSIAVNASLGKVLCDGGLTQKSLRLFVFIAGLVFNLGLLAYFKYAGFTVSNIDYWFGENFKIPDIILPIGISFITFQKIAFLVDAYSGKVRSFSFLNFALFVAFFPQLIAGPITHHAEVMPQFASQTVRNRFEDFAVGWSIFCVGLFKKVVVADGCAVYADAGYNMLHSGQSLDIGTAWIAVLGYSFQLYFDFSGYSDMAVGLARLFGIKFPANFHSPYKSTGIIEFWRRWHITLSHFLRDYLYFPLGGNRHGSFRRYLNLAIVMLLGGLWHGANWTFVVWGGVHGALLMLNHAWQNLHISKLKIFDSLPARAAFILLTFFVVTLAWIPFRSQGLEDVGRMLGALFPVGSDVASVWDLVRQNAAVHRFSKTEVVLWFIAVGAGTFLLPNSNQLFARFDPVLGFSKAQLIHWGSLNSLDWKVASVLAAMFVYSVLQLSRVSPFLYFQF